MLQLYYFTSVSVCCFSTAGCASQFEKIVDASEQNFQILCDNSETLFGSSLEECKVTACNYSSVVFHYLDNVCEILLCGASRREDLRLAPVTTGSNIYFKTETNVEEPLTTTVLSRSDIDVISTDLTHTPTTPLLPDWAIADIVIVVSLCIVAVVLVVVFGRRHKKTTGSGKSAVYENQAAGNTAQGGEGGEGMQEKKEPTQAGVYEEITSSNPAVMISSEDDTVIYHNTEDSAGYQGLAPDNCDINFETTLSDILLYILL